MKSRLAVFACAGMFFFAHGPYLTAQNAVADGRLFDPKLYNEVALLRVAVDELKVLVTGLKSEIATRRTELSDLRNQIKQEQGTLNSVRAQIAQERQTLAVLQREKAGKNPSAPPPLRSEHRET